ncbi:MAG: ABC transporter substrate-binding protein, partial [Candidatus Dormibacteraceae bacterium]
PDQDAVIHLVNEFNQQNQGKIHINAVYAGAYDDAFSKYKASIQSNNIPNIVQIYDIGSRFMIDSKTITPAQTFIDHYKYPIGDIYSSISGYYKVHGKQQSMPWNTSMPLLYVNTSMFQQAGISTSTLPTTFQQIEADSKIIKQKTGNPGFNAAIYGWYLEQWAARANVNYCNANNGRTGQATHALLTNSRIVQTLNWWTQGVQQGWGENTGTTTSDSDTAFEAGKVAMIVESTGSLAQIGEASHFTIGTSFYPRDQSWSSGQGGPIIGGASVWITNHQSSYDQIAAWKFEQFLDNPANQAYWHIHTGYMPINQLAQQQATEKAYIAAHPQFETAIKQLKATKSSYADQGCSMGAMPQARQDAQNAISNALTGKQTPQAALQQQDGIIDQAIKTYNQSLAG